MERKLCPLKFFMITTDENAPTFPMARDRALPGLICETDSCAWWNQEAKECNIASIGKLVKPS